jgi:hypothetical protein
VIPALFAVAIGAVIFTAGYIVGSYSTVVTVIGNLPHEDDER